MPRIRSAVAALSFASVFALFALHSFIGQSLFGQFGGSMPGGQCLTIPRPPVKKKYPAYALNTKESIQAGKVLFNHEWKPNDPLSGGGDGLGPMFNAKSCVACHFQGGVGGAGSNKENVLVLAAKLPRDLSAIQRGRFVANATKIHPGFLQANEINQALIFHRFSTDPKYEALRSDLLGFNYPKSSWSESRKQKYRNSIEKAIARSHGMVRLPKKHGISLVVTQRNTPPLFGVGLIDEISAESIEQIAAKQKAKRDGIEGKLAFAGFDSIGKFGWRGQQPSVQEFVMAACSVELGLDVDPVPQTQNPVALLRLFPKGQRRSLTPPRKLDMTEKQAAELISFVRSLPRPEQVLPFEAKHRNAVLEGEKVFNTIGCATCHVKNVDKVDSIYTDFLLHDMGDKFEDPIPASSTREESVNRGYLGSMRRLVAQNSRNAENRWQTPPLWGVADSGPWMHDGRARTLHDAITAHGGESARSSALYRRLSKSQKTQLIAFLNSLKAPQQKISVGDALRKAEEERIRNELEGLFKQNGQRP